MVKTKSLLLAGCTLLLSTIPFAGANAAAPMGFVGTVGASYANTESSDSWNLGGSGAFGLGPNFGAQVDLGFNSVESVNIWGVGGSLFWAPMMGRAGVTVQYSWFDESGVNLGSTRYGVFGEFYPGNFFTFGVKAGGETASVSGFGSSATETGWYVGGAVTGYVLPNLGIQGTVDFSSASSVDATTFGIGAEFLVSEAAPIAIFGGYSHTSLDAGLGGSADANTWLVGVRVYLGATGPTLVDKHRNGTLGWIGGASGSSLSP